MRDVIRRGVEIGWRRALVLAAAGLLVLLTTQMTSASAPGELILPEEQAVVDLVNEERARQGLPPLIVNYSLQEAAWSHNEHMVNTGCFSHDRCGNGTPFDRIRKTGYMFVTAGENIARGQRTPEAVMRSWMNSVGHRRNILSPNYTDIGVAYNPSGPTWTQVFARPQADYETVTPPDGGGTGPAPEPCVLPSDVNGDEKVDDADVSAVSDHFMLTPDDADWNPAADVVVDGIVNIYDVYQVVMDRGATCE